MVHGFWVGGRFYEENFNLNAAVVVHFNYKGYSPSSGEFWIGVNILNI